MTKGLLVVIVALLAGLATFYAVHEHKGGSHHDHGGAALEAIPELDWLKSDLKLSEEQFAKVRDLHVAYRPQCAEMCRRIAEAHEKIERIAAANKVITPEYKAALKEHADIHVECQEAMLRHLYETAATLNKEQSERYLKTMLPFALNFSRSESGNLQTR